MPLTAQHFIPILSPSKSILQFLHARLHRQSIRSSPRADASSRRRRARRTTHRRVQRLHRVHPIYQRPTTQRLDRRFARRQRALEPSPRLVSSSPSPRLPPPVSRHPPPSPPPRLRADVHTDPVPKRLVVERADVISPSRDDVRAFFRARGRLKYPTTRIRRREIAHPPSRRPARRRARHRRRVRRVRLDRSLERIHGVSPRAME